MHNKYKKRGIYQILKNIEDFLKDGREQLIFSAWEKKDIEIPCKGYSKEKVLFPCYKIIMEINKKGKTIILFGENHQNVRNISRISGKEYYEIVKVILRKLLDGLFNDDDKDRSKSKRRNKNKRKNSSKSNNTVYNNTVVIIMENFNSKMANKLRKEYPNYEWYFVSVNNRFNGPFYNKLTYYLLNMRNIIIYVGIIHLEEVIQKIYEIGLKDITPK